MRVFFGTFVCFCLYVYVIWGYIKECRIPMPVMMLPETGGAPTNCEEMVGAGAIRRFDFTIACNNSLSKTT